MRWNYKIVHSKEENERAIVDMREDGSLYWLAHDKIRTWDKMQAKRYINIEDCKSDLIIVRMSEQKEKEPERPKEKAQSWWQLS